MSARNNNRQGKVRAAKRTVGRRRKSSPQRATGNEYRLLFESNPSPMYVLAAKTLGFLAVNEAAVKQCGWTKAEFLRMTAGDISTAKEVRRLRAALKTQRGSHIAYRGLWLHRRKDGSLLDAELSARRIEFAGRPAYLVLITGSARRKQAEVALRESEKKFRALFESSRDALVIIDLEGRTLDCNAAVLRMLGLDSKEEFVGKGPAEFSPPRQPDGQDSRAAATKHIQEAFAKGTAFFEWQHQRRDGTVFPTTILLSRFQLGGQTVIQAAARDITDQKAALAALRESQALLEEVGRIAQVGGWEFDVASGAVKWTSELARLHDLAPGTLITGKSGLRFYHGDFRRKLEAAVREAIEHAKPYDLELEMVSAKGHRKWVRILGHPVVENQKVVKVQGSLQDITTRKRAEEALRENEERLRMALKAASMVTWEWDIPAGAIRYSANTPDVARGEAIEPYCSIKGVIQEVHPDDRAALTQIIQRTVSAGVPYEGHYRVKMLDGAYRWISARGDVVERKNGKPVRAVGISQDITERKQAEEALRASEERFRIIAASTPDHLLVQDRNLRYTLVMNPQLGLTEQDMIGKTDHDILLKAEADKVRRLKRKVLRTGQKLHVEMPATSRTGELEFFEGDYVPKRNVQGAVDGLIGYFRNVTARKRAEEALEQANSRLRRLAYQLTQVEEQERRRLAYVLHEGLQQLLVSAMFLLSNLGKEIRDRAVRERIAKLTNILDECVNLTRTATYDSYPPALHELGIGAALGWLGQYCQKNLGLSVDLQVDEAVHLEAEELKICLFRAAQELLLNVAKHARVKSARVRLWRDESGEVRLEVSDAGTGFDPVALRVSESTGSSFGLFSLRERVAMLGGRLEIQSAKGAGTKVSICVPASAKMTHAGDADKGSRGKQQ